MNTRNPIRHVRTHWNNKNPLKIVTHHWSNNINKGFDIYKYLDDLLDDKTWKKRIKFTYVGNIPKNFKFRNTHLIEPQRDNKLSVIFLILAEYIIFPKFKI